MPVIVLDLLKYLFIIVLYIFMARAVRAIYLELKPDRGRCRRPPSASKGTKKRPSTGQGGRGGRRPAQGEVLRPRTGARDRSEPEEPYRAGRLLRLAGPRSHVSHAAGPS